MRFIHHHRHLQPIYCLFTAARGPLLGDFNRFQKYRLVVVERWGLYFVGAIAGASRGAYLSETSTRVACCRLNRDVKGGAWCPRSQISAESAEWLQVDLHGVHVLTAVGTQGRFGNGQGQEFAEAFVLEYWRPRLGKWVRYRTHQGQEVRRTRTDCTRPGTTRRRSTALFITLTTPH